MDLLPEGDSVSCIVIPSNRLDSAKVKGLRAEADAVGLPVAVHERGLDLSRDLSPAEAGLCWLYSQIISARDLSRYSSGILNMHGGAIPEYRGASVLHWAIINGEEELGVTWHELVEAVDAGPIWVESRIPITPDATGADMRRAMLAEGLRLFPEAWARFRHREGTPRYPDLANGRVWRQRRPSDGSISQGWSERQVRDMVRALCPPWPPPFIETDQGRAFIESVELTPEPEDVPYVTSEGRTIFMRPRRNGVSS